MLAKEPFLETITGHPVAKSKAATIVGQRLAANSSEGTGSPR
jgi:hypothetical protein